MLDQDELDSVAPGRSRSMETRTFVDLDDIDPIYFDKTYYLGPGGEDTGKVYALLRAAMGESDKAAIARFVMRGKEYLAAVRADGDLLVLETLFFADEVREPHQQISNLPGRVKLTRQELRSARRLRGCAAPAATRAAVAVRGWSGLSTGPSPRARRRSPCGCPRRRHGRPPP
jgi:DNA end-binding protein Ku